MSQLDQRPKVRGTSRGKPAKTPVADARQLPEGLPFGIGDVVKLKSGGLEMTVTDIIEHTCGKKGAIVEVAWSSPGFDPRILRDMLPLECLIGQLEIPF